MNESRESPEKETPSSPDVTPDESAKDTTPSETPQTDPAEKKPAPPTGDEEPVQQSPDAHDFSPAAHSDEESSNLSGDATGTPQAKKNDSNAEGTKKTSLATRIFLVPSCDKKMNQRVHDFLNQLHVPLRVLNDPEEILTPMEDRFNAEPNIEFAVFVLSSDEWVYPKDGRPEEAVLRSRQQAVFDLGMLIGRFGKPNVIAIYKEQKSYRLPTEAFNALFVPLDEAGDWRQTLKRHLRLRGILKDA